MIRVNRIATLVMLVFGICLFIMSALAIAAILPAGTRSAYAGSYNRSAAVAYADQYAHSRNSAYLDFSPNDCTNYISQVLRNGGLPDAPGGNLDIRAWWYNLNNKSAYTNTWTSADWLNQHASQYQGTRFTYVSPGQQNAGDFLLMSFIPSGIPSHGRVIVGYGYSQEQVDPNTSPPVGTWGLLANQHSNDRKRVIWNDGIPAGTPLWPWSVVW